MYIESFQSAYSEFLMSKMDLSAVNRAPLKTVVSRKVISFSDISAVNFIVAWKLLASLIKKFHVFSVTVPKGENVINVTLPFSWRGVTLLD